MIGKILLTLDVIAVAYVFIRQRKLAEESAQAGSKGKSEAARKDKYDKHELAADVRIAAYLFLLFMVGIGAALYYYRWQDDHTVLTVYLHRDSQLEPISYQVYKYQLESRSFTTIDGTQVTVASSERMEITGLED